MGVSKLSGTAAHSETMQEAKRPQPMSQGVLPQPSASTGSRTRARTFTAAQSAAWAISPAKSASQASWQARETAPTEVQSKPAHWSTAQSSTRSQAAEQAPSSGSSPAKQGGSSRGAGRTASAASTPLRASAQPPSAAASISAAARPHLRFFIMDVEVPTSRPRNSSAGLGGLDTGSPRKPRRGLVQPGGDPGRDSSGRAVLGAQGRHAVIPGEELGPLAHEAEGGEVEDAGEGAMGRHVAERDRVAAQEVLIAEPGL